jgi:hypothetical protein
MKMEGSHVVASHSVSGNGNTRKDSGSNTYVSVMDETNGQMASINETMLESKVAVFKIEVRR